MNISFVAQHLDPSFPPPVAASKKIPEWYKDLPRYIGGEKKPHADDSGSTNATIKTCMPVLDTLTSGYLILSSSDAYITKKEEGRFYNWASNDLVTFHGQNQLTGYPKLSKNMKNENLPKFTNTWIVKTPKNYSCLFITPMHHDLPFTILPGIVDTDNYFNAINFPFIPDPDFEGLIPRGTPIAHVIPFCRESWKMSIDSIENSKEAQKDLFHSLGVLKSSFFDKYKKNYWVTKEFK